tara:strand:+ start:1097 stop:1366 length:270 start_codon:yes stop_codon:yes gene_type:complete
MIETYYSGNEPGAIADMPFGMVFLDYVLGRIEDGDPDDRVHEEEIIQILSSGGIELERQRRQIPFIQEEVSPIATEEIPSWIWIVLNIK